MAENDNKNTNTPATTEPDEGALGDAGKKALQQERKARRDAEAALRDAQSRIDDLERGNVLGEVARDRGLTPSQAERLKGSTREELEADADDLLESFKPDPVPKPPGAGRPREALRPGASGDDEPDDARGVVDRILGPAI